MRAYITGSGMFVPDRIVTNEEIAEQLSLDPEQILKSSGVRNRRWAAAGTPTSALAAPALEAAIADATLTSGDIDYLLLGTMTPDRFIPGTAPQLQKTLNLGTIPCLDIRATCCNALYGLQIAKSLVISDTVKNVALAFAEVQSPSLDLSAEAGKISMLFGDGASAFIVSNREARLSLEVLDVLLETDGSFVDDLGIRSPGSLFNSALSGDDKPRMNGQAVIRHAGQKIVAACEAVLARNNLTINDVSWLVPHQANSNLLQQVARNLNFTREEGVVSVLENYGNTSSASIGIALDSLRHSGRIQPNDYLLLPAFGAGFTWGAALCRA